MADPTNSINNKRQFASELETKPLAISEYEHLEVLFETEETVGEVPSKRGRAVDQANLTAATSAPKVWRTRRRRDGKMFLAAEYVDTLGVMNEAQETLLRLLNHPNLVCLIDIVQDSNISTRSKDYTVWEDCNRGTLNRLLWHACDQERAEIPESLCWQVLDGISQALVWLHHGHKHTFPFDQHMIHDDDWHPVTIVQISPVNIYFTIPEGEETYGDVKLGCFRSAAVSSTSMFVETFKPPWVRAHGPYMAPEIQRNTHMLSPAADVWSLGAVLYCMMCGQPPTQQDVSSKVGNVGEDDFWVKAIPSRYSTELKKIVRAMLRVDRTKRPTAGDLSVNVDHGMNIWRDSTSEGKRFITKGEDRNPDPLRRYSEDDHRTVF